MVIVQDPDTAFHGSMPAAAINARAADHVLPLEEIAPALVSLVETGEFPRKAVCGDGADNDCTRAGITASSP